MNYLKELKEKLKDPKKKAFAQFALYGIFFIIVFVLLSGGNGVSPTSPIKTKESATELYNNIVLPKRATTGSAGYDFKVPFELK